MSSLANPEQFIYGVPEGWAKRAYADASQYREMYGFSISAPDKFWEYHGRRIDWIKPYTKVKDTSFDPGKVSIKWFEDGTTNVSVNCIDRHLATRGDPSQLSGKGTTRTIRSSSATRSCTNTSAVLQMC